MDGGRPAAAAFVGPPAGGGAGPAEVQLSPDARAHPSGEVVRAQLQAHYGAINAGDYAAWRETVVPARSERLPEAAWKSAYATTRDGSIRVERIDDVPGGGVVVRVRFVSTQDPADAPPGLPAARICWRSSLPMTGSPPRIGATRDGSSVPEVC